MLFELLYVTGLSSWPGSYVSAVWKLYDDCSAWEEKLRQTNAEDLRNYGNRVAYVADLASRESSLAAYFSGITDAERDYLGMNAGCSKGIEEECMMLQRLRTAVFPGERQVDGLLAHCRIFLRLSELMMMMWHVEVGELEPLPNFCDDRYPNLTHEDWVNAIKAREHPETWRYCAFSPMMHHDLDSTWPGTFPDMVVEFAHKEGMQTPAHHGRPRDEYKAQCSTSIAASPEPSTVKQRTVFLNHREALST